MEATPHRPVMLEETLLYLAPQPGGVYCDATLGAGGHAEQLLLRSAPSGCLIGIDRDATALRMAAQRMERFGGRFVPVQGHFGDLEEILARCGIRAVDGLLADLGVSSMQLDQPARGFSWQGRGPIDMRMDAAHGETAADLLARLDADELADILREYGEERHARRIARAIVQAKRKGSLGDTQALAAVVSAALPAHQRGKHPATRTFQALRIAVNDELRQLHRLLDAAPRCLAPGGRLVVIAFHSLEDRLVKLHLRRAAVTLLEQGSPVVPSATPADGSDDKPASGLPLVLLTRKPVLPSQHEVAANPRARSARLRAARMLTIPERAAQAVQEGPACRY